MRLSTRHIVTLVCTAALLQSTSAWAEDHHATESQSSTAGEKDKKAAVFLKDAHTDNEKEIAMAELALAKAQHPELKSFARHLKRDHTEARAKLASLAQKHGADLQQTSKHKDLQRLEKLSGSEFDREFTLAALKDHQKDVKKYQTAAQMLTAHDVKAFAQENLPKLQQHLKHAVEAARTVGIDQDTIAQYSKELPEAVGGSSSAGEPSSSTGSGSDSNSSTTSGSNTSQGHHSPSRSPSSDK